MVGFVHADYLVFPTMRRSRHLLTFLLTSLTSLSGLPTQAQIIPDQTLGAEQSIVTPNIEVRGRLADLIEGGAIRGSNLFHSFGDLNVGEVEQIYFANPVGIESILSRVTGNSPSDIFGTLGVDGTADLFLINPNGIVFGPQVNLDVGGSFYATTAEAISLGESTFSAVAPEQSQLLAIRPNTSFFNYLSTSSGDIENRGQLVIFGEEVVLAGNNIDVQEQIVSFGNASLLAIGKIDISSPVLSFGNVNFQADELVVSGRLSAIATSSLTSNKVGDIVLEVNRLRLLAGGQIATNTRTDADGGNIVIDAAESVIASGVSDESGSVQRSGVQADTNGFGDAGDIVIETPYLLVEEGARIGSQVQEGGSGTGGDVNINAGKLSMRSGGQITAGTFSEGEGGILTVKAPEFVTVSGTDGDDSPSGLFTATYGYADANDLIIDTASLSVLEGGQVSTSTLGIGRGQGGNLMITATDVVNVVGSSSSNTQFFSTISSSSGILLSVDFRGAAGNSGDLTVTTRNLNVQNGGRISTESLGSGRNPFFPGEAGEAGDLTVVATGFVNLTDGFLRTRTSGLGNAGNLSITAENLYIFNGGEVTASTRGQGDGGNLSVIVAGITDVSESGLGTVSFPEDNSGDVGDAGDVYLQTDQLRVRNGAEISTSAIGFGQAGAVDIVATDFLEVNGGIFRSGAQANALIGRTVYDPDEEVFQSSSISTTAGSIAENPAGDLTITAGKLRIINGGRLEANSLFRNAGGNLTITATESIEVGGVSRSGEVSTISAQAIDTGDAGNIRLETDSMSLRERGQIIASSRGEGKAGNLIFNIYDRLTVENGLIGTSSEQSSGGSINIQARELRLIENGDIRTNVNNGTGNGGDIGLAASSIVAFDDSDILAFAADGTGGNINLDTRAFFGENYQPSLLSTNPQTLEGNNRVDINATGRLASGNIALPDVSFIEDSLSELSGELIDSETLVVNSCIARSNDTTGSFNLISVGDRLPQAPTETISNSYATGTVQPTLPEASEPVAIAEPLAVYRLADGRLVISAPCK